MADKPSYLRALLTSEANLYAGLGSAALGAVLSIPFGFGIGLMPVIVFAAGEAIAGLYVPESAMFRARVDAAHRKRQREVAREHLCHEIDLRAPGMAWDRKSAQEAASAVRSRLRGSRTGDVAPARNADCLEAYQQMADQVASLYRIAADRQTQLTGADIERLEDATLDFLSLWLASLVSDDRAKAVDAGVVRKRIADLDDQLGKAVADQELRQLRRAREDYSDLLSRQAAMQSKRQAVEAAMMAMPDQVEEIYQMVMAAPYSSSISPRLTESLSRLRLEEELEQELDEDLGQSIPARPGRNEQQLASQAARTQSVPAGK